ncbi:hypothetical protein ACO2Q8_24870 [Larkinella sp. VNQ87]|uniref:hypothetical protein n=1 Tax=Larkinella sp. VNQ87 TaxID=3400921 RepID=UPI003C05ADFB
MKPTLSFVLLFGGWLLGGCDPRQADKTARKAACRIQKIVIANQSDVSTQTNETNFSYDDDGNLTRKTQVQNQTYPSGIGNQVYSVTDSYIYDNNGFLTTEKTETSERTTLPNNTTRTLQRLSTTTYTYTDGRLTRSQTRYQNPYGVVTNSTVVFTYNEKGELFTKTDTRTTETVPDDAPEKPVGTGQGKRVWTYQNSKLVDYVEQFEGTENRPLTLQNGLVTKMVINGGYVQQNTYDSQNRVLKTEEYLNGKLTTYFMREWSEAKPATNTLPVFKGHPIVQPEFGSAGVLIRYDPYAINAQTNAVQHLSETISRPEVNAQGWVASATGEIRQLHPAALPQRTTVTETYTYTDCQ